MTPVLEIVGLTARAGGDTLLDGVDLTLDAGRTVAVVGASGAGKSTLGLAVLGEAAPGVALAGRVRVDGTGLLGDDLPDDAGSLRSRRAGRVGHLPQHPGTVLDPVRRCGAVLRELAALAHPSDRVSREAAVTAALERARLEPALARRFPHQLSGGQQQRMALAQTVVTGPSVVVLDEPTTGLDPQTVAELVEELGALAAAGTALVLLTHDADVARALADEVVALDAGRVIRRGDPTTILGPATDSTRREAARTGSHRLEVAGLTVHAPDGSVVLERCDLRATAGEWVAVQGRSGAGKTTLARSVAGLVAPRTGWVSVDGTRLAAAVARRPAAQRRLVQYVHQDAASSFLPDRPVLAQVARAGTLLRGLDRDEAQGQAEALLERLGVTTTTATRRPGGLSGGQLQRAAVARALLVRPAVFVADEMTSALDPEHRRDVIAAVDAQRHAHAMTVLAVAHDHDLNAAVADRVVTVEGGGLRPCE